MAAPAVAAARDRLEFVLAHLGALHARIRTGYVVREEEAAAATA
jgi:hypothetical protein